MMKNGRDLKLERGEKITFLLDNGWKCEAEFLEIRKYGDQEFWVIYDLRDERARIINPNKISSCEGA